jgi:2-iminobutanoate/2-iminopropanoate deaminase
MELRWEKSAIVVPGFAQSISHYCDAVKFGDLLFLSGITALDETNTVVGEDDVVEQAEAVFRNIETILNLSGATFADILKVTVLLTDINDREKINSIRKRYFGSSKPASTLFEVSRLALPAMKIEIEAVVGLRRA